MADKEQKAAAKFASNLLQRANLFDKEAFKDARFMKFRDILKLIPSLLVIAIPVATSVAALTYLLKGNLIQVIGSCAIAALAVPSGYILAIRKANKENRPEGYIKPSNTHLPTVHLAILQNDNQTYQQIEHQTLFAGSTPKDTELFAKQYNQQLFATAGYLHALRLAETADESINTSELYYIVFITGKTIPPDSAKAEHLFEVSQTAPIYKNTRIEIIQDMTELQHTDSNRTYKITDLQSQTILMPSQSPEEQFNPFTAQGDYHAQLLGAYNLMLLIQKGVIAETSYLLHRAGSYDNNFISEPIHQFDSEDLFNGNLAGSLELAAHPTMSLVSCRSVS